MDAACFICLRKRWATDCRWLIFLLNRGKARIKYSSSPQTACGAGGHRSGGWGVDCSPGKMTKTEEEQTRKKEWNIYPKKKKQEGRQSISILCKKKRKKTLFQGWRGAEREMEEDEELRRKEEIISCRLSHFWGGKKTSFSTATDLTERQRKYNKQHLLRIICRCTGAPTREETDPSRPPPSIHSHFYSLNEGRKDGDNLTVGRSCSLSALSSSSRILLPVWFYFTLSISGFSNYFRYEFKKG